MKTRTGWLIEAAALGAITAVVAAGYWATQPPLYNPAGSIDPWLYTALFINFDQIYAAFSETYYPTRLPLIVPGYVLNLLFDPTTAYFLLHGGFFLAGGVFVYLLARSWFGPRPAAAAYAWMTGCQLYFAAHRWDYWDGTIITYLAAALFFGLTPPPRPHLRFVWLGVAGFFVAAAVVTNLFVLALALPLPLIYATVKWPGSVSVLLRRAAADVAAFLGGSALLLLGCGLFAVANGGSFWFIVPQINAARIIDSAAYKQDYAEWVPQEPRIIVPFVLVAMLAALVFLSASARSSAHRAALGACVYLGSLCLVLAFHELALGGYFMEYLYYFNPLLPAMALCFAAICFLLARELPRWVGIGTVVATLAAVEIALFHIYWGDSIDRAGRFGYVAAATLFGLGAIAVTVWRLLSRRLFLAKAAALLAVLTLAGGSAYAFDGSVDTFERADTAGADISADTFHVSQPIVSYLTSQLGDERLPAFWYDDSVEGGAHVGIQSMYYYSYTYLGLDLPRLNGDFKARLLGLSPDAIVLLCSRRSCDGGPGNLRRAGIPITFHSDRLFEHGDLKVWVRIFDLAKK